MQGTSLINKDDRLNTVGKTLYLPKTNILPIRFSVPNAATTVRAQYSKVASEQNDKFPRTTVNMYQDGE